VGYFDYETLWSRPEWTDAPTGYDVPARVGWWPIVTWVQLVGDLIAGFSTPPGHGHNYAADYGAGWAAVAPPAGTKDPAGLMQRPQSTFMRKCVDHIVGGEDEVKRQVVEGAQISKICLTDADLRHHFFDVADHHG
jgi:hypothetical protein